MADHTPIEWTDATWNPTVGCSIVSPGCTNCYAMQVANGLERRFGSAKYRGLTKVVNGNPVWTGEVRLDEDALLQPLRLKKPRRIFVNSMSDLFHETLPDEMIDKVFAVMALCPQHQFQVLTKRAERMRAYCAGMARRREALGDLMATLGGPDRPGWYAIDSDATKTNFVGAHLPLPNVWLGVSAERQQEADERIPLLLETPAAVRFVSLEPLLGTINLERLSVGDGAGWCNAVNGLTYWGPGAAPIGPHLDWVIVGGESGPHARPMHPDWARELRDQCTAAGVPFFFKQWGEWQAVYDREVEDPDWRRCDVVARETPNGRWLNLEGGHGFHGERVLRVTRVGKRAAGRLLDGRAWNEFPAAADPPPQSGGGGGGTPVTVPFADALAALGVKLPLHVGRNVEAGVIFDADKKPIATVDVDRTRSDRAALGLAKLIAEAVNARAAP